MSSSGSRDDIRDVAGVVAAAVAVAVILVVLLLRSTAVTAVEEEAVRSAATYTAALASFRTLYTAEVVEPLRAAGADVRADYPGHAGAIPLPATFTILLGERIGETGGGEKVRLYSDLPFPSRKDGGPRDDFEREALAALQKKPEEAYHRFESSGQGRVLRYAVADRMRASCVACHNAHPDSPKRDWRVGDVRGVLSVSRPVAPVSVLTSPHLRQTTLIMIVAGVVVAVSLIFAFHRVLSARAAAEMTARLKANFLANMSHEIRTPMNGVLGMLELLLRTKLDAQQAKYAKAMETSSHALMNVINDILDFSKLEAGRVVLVPVDLDVEQLLAEIAELVAAPAQAKGVEVVVDVDPDLPRRVRADAVRLRQVLGNLAGNAVKFTERGEVVLKARVTHKGSGKWANAAERAGEEAVVSFSVKDTGPGVPELERERIFQPFLQLDDAGTRKHGGTGLGLAISRQLATLMGGTLTVESRAGVGSVFSLTIPATLLPPAPPDARATAALAGKSVFCVDDNETNRALLQENLTRWGLRPTVTALPHEALAAVRRAAQAGTPYALVLLDMQMPGMTGADVARAIRADALLKDTPVGLLTSLAGGGGLDDARLDFTLMKPLRTSDLYSAIVTLFAGPQKKKEQQQEATPSPSSARVLVVEDNLANQAVVLEFLEVLHVPADLAEDGERALALWSQQKYGAILMDCQLPGRDGFEVTADLRRREGQQQKARTSIIALTAHALSDERKRAFAAGVDDYLSKPVTLGQLRSALERAGVLTPPPAPPLTLGPRVLAALKKQAPQDLADIEAALAAGDTEKLRATAHRLKGTLTIAGLAPASCAAIEQAAKDKKLAEVPALVQMTRAELTRLGLLDNEPPLRT